jgi:hypothetical protein
MMPNGQTLKDRGTTTMFALHSRKALLVALLATALAAPASASDGLMTTQMVGMVQNYAEAGPSETGLAEAGGGTIVQQASQVESKSQVGESAAPAPASPAKVAAPQKPPRQKVTELRPAVAGMRQPSVGGHAYRAAPPLILGIGY